MENLLPDRDRGRKTDCRINAPACGGGGGLWLWKHEGKEKTVAQKDGTKGSAYRWTPQRLLGTKLKPWSNGYRMLLRSEQKLRC